MFFYRGPNPYPPGGFMTFMNSTASPEKRMGVNRKQSILLMMTMEASVVGLKNACYWTKLEDLRLVC